MSKTYLVMKMTRGGKNGYTCILVESDGIRVRYHTLRQYSNCRDLIAHQINQGGTTTHFVLGNNYNFIVSYDLGRPPRATH